MTRQGNHVADQTHPGGFDSIDFYTRHGHALHARAAREGFSFVWQMLRRLARS